jgi:hypothetical protein
METSSQLHAQAVLSIINFALFPSNKRLCRFLIQCEQFGDMLLPRIENPTPPPQQHGHWPTQYADRARPAPLLLSIIIICINPDQTENVFAEMSVDA